MNTKGHLLACFAGGFWALSSVTLDNGDDLEIAEGVTQSCRTSYTNTATGLGPEAFNKYGKPETTGTSYYILRPEVVESYFYLWRVTKDEKYRNWAWDVVLALEEHCKSQFGYAGLHSVETGQKNDNQESFFLAETLK